MPCRILTHAEVELTAHTLGVPYLIVQEHMRDPEHCPFHEMDVENVGQIIRQCRDDDTFGYCKILGEHGTIREIDDICPHFAVPHYYSIDTMAYEPVRS